MGIIIKKKLSFGGSQSFQIAFFSLRWSSSGKICLAQVRKCLWSSTCLWGKLWLERKEGWNSLQLPEQQLKETPVTPTSTVYLSKSEDGGSQGVLCVKMTSPWSLSCQSKQELLPHCAIKLHPALGTAFLMHSTPYPRGDLSSTGSGLCLQKVCLLEG